MIPVASKIRTIAGTMRRAKQIVQKEHLQENGYKGLSLNAAERKDLFKVIEPLTTCAKSKNKYFDEIPIKEIAEALSKKGVEVIQEDGNEWSGILTGADSRTTFQLAKKDEDGVFKELKNVLAMTWYKMGSGKYEIVAYIG